MSHGSRYGLAHWTMVANDFARNAQEALLDFVCIGYNTAREHIADTWLARYKSAKQAARARFRHSQAHAPLSEQLAYNSSQRLVLAPVDDT